MYIFKTFVLILQSFREWSKESYGGEFYLTYWYIEWFLCYNVVYNVFFNWFFKNILYEGVKQLC